MWEAFYDERFKLWLVVKNIEESTRLCAMNGKGGLFNTPYKAEAKELADKLNGDSDD